MATCALMILDQGVGTQSDMVSQLCDLPTMLHPAAHHHVLPRCPPRFTLRPTTICIPAQVHVIVFGADEQEQEGVYSHRSMGKDGLPIETIIGFQSSEDALR